MRFFAWYTRYLLVDYYQLFIILPVALTCFLGFGIYWAKELTLLDARKLYTPVGAPCWEEERVMKEVCSCETLTGTLCEIAV